MHRNLDGSDWDYNQSLKEMEDRLDEDDGEVVDVTKEKPIETKPEVKI